MLVYVFQAFSPPKIAFLSGFVVPVQLYITVGDRQDQCCLQVVGLGGWVQMSANST